MYYIIDLSRFTVLRGPFPSLSGITTTVPANCEIVQTITIEGGMCKCPINNKVATTSKENCPLHGE